jgi:hypothetical protein
MIAPEILFRMHPEDAVRAMIGEKVKRPMKADYLRLGKPKSLGGLRTSVEVTLDRSRAPVELWDREGSYFFEYDRTDIGQFLQSTNRTLKTALPVDVVNILTAILSPFAIPVDEQDVVPAVFLTLGQADINANDDSYRWVGDTTATLIARVIELSTLLKVARLIVPFDRNYKSSTVKDSIALQLSMANATALDVPITAAMFALSAPVVNGSTTSEDNTKVDLTFNGLPYSGTVSVTYQRRSFGNTFRKPVQLSGTQLSNKQQLATKLSVQMGCEILAADIRNEVFPAQSVGSVQDIPVTFDDSSLAYVGTVLVKYRRTS